MPTQPHYHGHRARLRARLQRDSTSMADYELLELLLGYVLVRQDTKPLAKKLLAQFRSLRGILNAHPNELQDIEGIGASTEALFLLVREIVARYDEGALRLREVMADPEAVERIARARLAGSSVEEVWVAFVDAQNRLIEWERLRQGSIHTVPLDAREIVEKIVHYRASGIVLVHNHPGGSLLPSPADVTITKNIRDAADLVHCRLLDHIVVSDISCFSLHKSGVLNGV